MASHFDRWEKDPFFFAAEEVQQSADRMESAYRTWIHSIEDSSSVWNPKELCRDLRTALGTTKWQLEEFECAVKSSYTDSIDDDVKERHHEFVVAIESQIAKVESSLREPSISNGKPPVPWVHLNEGESKELAAFLSGQSIYTEKAFANGHMNHIGGKQSANPQTDDKESLLGYSNNSQQSVDWNPVDAPQEKLPEHRRTASAGAEISAWHIAVADDVFPDSSSSGRTGPPPRRIPSLSGLLSTMEMASKLKWSKNGHRKLKNVDHRQEADSTSAHAQQLMGGISTCYERSKSCLDDCDDCYEKQLYGWYGAIQRLLQRSQYQMQYSRPLQVVFWIVLLCLIGAALYSLFSTLLLIMVCGCRSPKESFRFSSGHLIMRGNSVVLSYEDG